MTLCKIAVGKCEFTPIQKCRFTDRLLCVKWKLDYVLLYHSVLGCCTFACFLQARFDRKMCSTASCLSPLNTSVNAISLSLCRKKCGVGGVVLEQKIPMDAKSKYLGISQNRTQAFCMALGYSSTEACQCLKLVCKKTPYRRHVGQGVAFTEILLDRSIESHQASSHKLHKCGV